MAAANQRTERVNVKRTQTMQQHKKWHQEAYRGTPEHTVGIKSVNWNKDSITAHI